MICDKCKDARAEAIKIPNMRIKKCPHCGSIFIDNWMEQVSEKDLAIDHILKYLKIADLKLKFSGNAYNRKVEYEGLIDSKAQTNGRFFIMMSLSSCPTCTLKRGNYYEAVLQLRGGTESDLDRALSYSIKMVNDSKSREIFITRSEKKKEGYDILISDKQFTRNIGKRLIQEFGGVYTETSHLVGRKEGQEVYRITVSIRIPTYHPGDILKFQGEFLMVEKIRGNDVTLHNIINDNIIKIKMIDLDEFSIFERKENIKEATFLYRDGETVYVLDPYDNKEKAVIDKINRKKFYVAKIDDDLYFVPIELVS